MVSEACATDRAVIAIAQDYISPKHKRFIQSIRYRLSNFNDLKAQNTPIDTLNEVSKQVLLKL
jgi:mitochondrial fission protein ELM1